MNADTINLLLDLNRQFYQTLAEQFASTRQSLQPGVRRVLEALPSTANVLDLGCGNGGFWRALSSAGHRGSYTGLDASEALIRQAGSESEAFPSAAKFIQADLSRDDWDAALSGSPFDFILAFSVLHHLPGQGLRQRVVAKIRRHLAPGGRFIHSEWQFLNSARLRKRILPWETVGLTQAQVDPGDYLLDWKHGGYGLRYVHHFSPEELAALAESGGFAIAETFYSDGEGGKLGIYQTWS